MWAAASATGGPSLFRHAVTAQGAWMVLAGTTILFAVQALATEWVANRRGKLADSSQCLRG